MKNPLLVIVVLAIILPLFGQNQELEDNHLMTPYERVKSLNLGDNIYYLGDFVYAYEQSEYDTYFIKDQFEKFGNYSEKRNSKWGLVNANCVVLEQARWDKIGAPWYKDNTLFAEGGDLTRFNDGMIPVGVFKKDKTKGRGYMKTVYGHYLYGYADTTAKVIIKPAFEIAGPFSEGLAPVAKKLDGLLGYIDKTGNWIIKPRFIKATSFSEGLAAVAYVDDNERIVMGYIDHTGKMLLEIDWLGICREMKWEHTNDNRLGCFRNGTALIFANQLWFVMAPEDKEMHYSCLIDKKGHLWEESGVIHGSALKEDSFIAVKRDSLWGVIDSSGNIIMSPQSLFPPAGILNVDSINDDDIMDVIRTGHNPNYLILFYDHDEHGAKEYYYDFKGDLIYKRFRPWKPLITVNEIPSEVTSSHLVFSACVESDSEIDYCKVFLNGIEVQEDSALGGSAIVEDPKKKDNYDITISRTLALRDGTNTIMIKVKNAGGEKEEQKTIEYKPNNMVVIDASIVWGDIPTAITYQQMELDATIKSTVEDVSCRVLLNGNEVPKTKGSSIVEDPKEAKYKYKYPMKRTLTLQEGANTIGIEVRDSKGELVKSEQKQVTYSKPAFASIEWVDVPSTTEEKQLSLRARIKSDSKIEYCHVTFNGSRMKGSNIVENDYNLSVNETLSLVEGENRIKIEVKNRGGEVVAEKTVVYVQKEKRIALVIGNADYENLRFPKLNKTIADAQAMHTLLKSYGFDMRPLVLNADLKKMREAINDFVDEVGRGGYEVALIYYSGHGLTPDGGANYLIPIDADIDYSDEVKHNAINSKTELISRLEEKNCRVEIVLLDCCNDCTLAERSTKGAYDGHLIPVNPKPFGISIIHAAQPGKKALEGEGKNSPFVESFIECTRNHPNVGWESFVNEFIIDVQLRTNNYQTPYPEGRIIGKPFYINPNFGK